MSWSPFSWVFKSVSSALWGNGFAPNDDFPLGADSQEWEKYSFLELQEKVQMLDQKAQRLGALLNSSGASAEPGFDAFAYAATLSAAARMADWNGHPASEVAVRYRAYLRALDKKIVAETLRYDVDVAAWKKIAEDRLDQLRTNPKFKMAVQDAEAEFDARVSERAVVQRQPPNAQNEGAVAPRGMAGAKVPSLSPATSVASENPAPVLMSTTAAALKKGPAAARAEHPPIAATELGSGVNTTTPEPREEDVEGGFAANRKVARALPRLSIGSRTSDTPPAAPTRAANRGKTPAANRTAAKPNNNAGKSDGAGTGLS